MASRLTKQAVTEVVPAVEAVIGMPARCVTVVQRSLVTTSYLIYVRRGSRWFWENSGPISEWVELPTTICYPAVEAVEGRDGKITVDNQLGWNSGAISFLSMPGDGLAKFVIRGGSVAAAAGLADPLAPIGGLGAIHHGVILTYGTNAQILESGVVVETSPTEPSGDVSVVIRRTGNTVTYDVDGWTYTSLSPASGPASLVASLYCAGDEIKSASIGPLAPLRSSGPWGWVSDVEAGQMYSADGWDWEAQVTIGDGKVTMELPLSVVASDYAYGSVRMTMDEPQVSAIAGFVDVESAGVSVSIPMNMTSIAIDVDLSDLEVDIPMSMRVSDYDYGSVHMEFENLEGFSVDNRDPPGVKTASEVVVGIDEYAFDPVIYLAINEGLTVGSALSVLISMDANLADFLMVDGTSDASMLLYAMLSSGIRTTDNASSVAEALQQYATNLVTGAVTMYKGFDFQGFCRVDSTTYGYKADGLYEVGGSTDDGEFIDAAVELAATDFGTTTRKRLDAVFLGMSTDGQVLVKLVDDSGVEVVYSTIERGSVLRANPARGSSSRFWRTTLQIVDATYADLDRVEWLVGATGRRTTR